MAKPYKQPYVVEGTFELTKMPLLAAINDSTFEKSPTKKEDPEGGGKDPVRAQLGFERYNGGTIALGGKYAYQILFQLYRGTGVMDRTTFSNMRGLNTELPPGVVTEWLEFPVISHRGFSSGGGLTRYEAVMPGAEVIIPLRWELQASHVDYDEFEQAVRQAADRGQLRLGLAKNSAGYGELRCIELSRLD